MVRVDTWWSEISLRCVVGVLSLSVASLMGCRGAGQEQHGGEPHTAQTKSIASVEFPTPAELGKGVAHVFAGQALGMTLTASGAAGRSVADLEQHIATFLPQLQELYVRELVSNASLMGSIDVKLVIEPNGAVSDLRFPDIGMTSQRLKTIVFDHMRGWVFPSAAEQVQLRYRLLFVPPQVDAETILAWETRTKRMHNGKPLRITAAPALAEGSSAVETAAASSLPVLASERTSLSEIGKPPPIPELHGHVPTDNTEMAETRTAEPEFDPALETIIGWYRVTHSSMLYKAPHEYADVVAQLRQGMRVRVVDVIEDEWLEIHSVTDRPPGYLRIEHAVPDETRHADWS